MQAARKQAQADAAAAAYAARHGTQALERTAFAKNSFKCTQCGRVHHPGVSPLVLCDFCPRAYHLKCLEVPEGGLPELEWACPKCLERHATAAARAQGGNKRRASAAIAKAMEVRPVAVLVCRQV